jgi:hypothetical protein
LHVAVALAAAGQPDRLAALGRYAATAVDPVLPAVVAPVVHGLELLLANRPGAAADVLAGVLPTLWRVGGSAAQREVVEDTLLFTLVEAGRWPQAKDLLDRRLDRRPSPREQARRARLERITR